MRYRLRTLLILLAIGPPIVAWYVWPRVRETYQAWQAQQMNSATAITPAGGGVAGITGNRRIVLLQSWQAQQAMIAQLEIQIKSLELQMSRLDRDSSNAGMRLAALEAELAQVRNMLSQIPKPLKLARPVETAPIRQINSPEVERAMLHDGMLIK